MSGMIRFLFNIVKAIVLLAIVAIVGGVAFFLSIRETIPDLFEPQTPLTREAAASYGAAIEKSREALIAERQNDYYPSLSVSVIRKGALLWSEATGLSDIKSRQAATPETLYPIGSISKPLTAVLVMKLAEQGDVDLDAPIANYARNLSEPYAALTLRQLLSHQGGVRHYKFALIPPAFTENGMNREFESAEESLEIFIDDPLLFEPDQSFQYSTYGYTLVSYVLEQATGETFPALIDSMLFDPLALDHTAPDKKKPRTEGRSTDYMSILKRLGIFQSPETNSSYKWAGGGFLSSPNELAQFGDALLHEGFLNDDSFEEMTTPRRMATGDINPQFYGLGWRMGDMPYPRGGDERTPIIHHGGTAPGSQCALLLTPEFGISVAICGNAFTGGSGGLIQLAANIARDFENVARSAPSITRP